MRFTSRVRASASGFALMGVGFGGLHSVPRQVDAPVGVKLIIWPKRAGTTSGAKMDVSVDGAPRGSIANLDGQMLIELGALQPGVHNFALGHITGYSVDQNGIVQRVPGVDGTCTGQFVVQPYQSYYLVVATTQDGQLFQCTIQ